MSSTDRGLILIADINGYSVYLSESELDHARATLESLLKVLIDHTRPPLVISRLAGDAVISYTMDDQLLRGQTFVEMIEDTYVSFRKAIDLMILNNTCHCRACANVSALDLKFLVHCGAFAIQHIDEHSELVGSDVNLIHRLLKNRVTEETGIRAYTLYTQAAVDDLGLEDITRDMPRHTEEYEHIGRVQARVQDMHPIWQEKRGAQQIVLAPEDGILEMEARFPMPPHILWEYLLAPEFRSLLFGSDRQDIIDRANGRLAQGSTFQCFHGDEIFLQTILEYQPFERMVTEDRVMIGLIFLVEYRLIPEQNGTRFVMRMGKPRGPLRSRLMFRFIMGAKSAKASKENFDRFVRKVKAAVEERGKLAPPDARTSREQIEEAAAISVAAHQR
jgi:uncharacterized protein YndB with AHSA1/START domain